MWVSFLYDLLCMFSMHVLADSPKNYDENLIEMYVHGREVEKIKNWVK